MSDKNSSLINLPDLPDSIDTAVKNLTDKPTQGVGQTLADVWYLVFGGITQAADKRRMKYAHDLELYKQELSQKIASIERLGIIALDTSSSFSDKSVYAPFEETDYYKTFSSKAIRSYASKRATIHKYLGFFTPLGKNFFEVCVK